MKGGGTLRCVLYKYFKTILDKYITLWTGFVIDQKMPSLQLSNTEFSLPDHSGSQIWNKWCSVLVHNGTQRFSLNTEQISQSVSDCLFF